VPAGGPARSSRARRRELGQHDLIDRRAVDRLVRGAAVAGGDLVVDVGAGHGSITEALVQHGARVVAIELDRARAARLGERYATQPAVRVVQGDALRVRLPRRPYSVVANPPFSITTRLLHRLLDVPAHAPARVDLVLQRQAARFLAATAFDPVALGWAPWFELVAGPRVPRHAFRPQPPCDAAVLTVVPRAQPLLPAALAPRFAAFVAAHHTRWAAPDRGAAWWARRFRTRF
jgi:23S rRNA (adenine-N6)-dimethyltransferase